MNILNITDSSFSKIVNQINRSYRHIIIHKLKILLCFYFDRLQRKQWVLSVNFVVRGFQSNLPTEICRVHEQTNTEAGLTFTPTESTFCARLFAHCEPDYYGSPVRKGGMARPRKKATPGFMAWGSAGGNGWKTTAKTTVVHGRSTAGDASLLEQKNDGGTPSGAAGDLLSAAAAQWRLPLWRWVSPTRRERVYSSTPEKDYRVLRSTARAPHCTRETSQQGWSLDSWRTTVPQMRENKTINACSRVFIYCVAGTKFSSRVVFMFFPERS